MRRDFALERRARCIAWAAVTVGAIGMFILYWPWAAPAAWRIAVGCGGVTLIWVALIIWIWRLGRTASDAYDHRFLICPSCRYNVRGLPEAGACPECGRQYTHDELAQIWKREMGMPHLEPEDELRMLFEEYEKPWPR